MNFSERSGLETGGPTCHVACANCPLRNRIMCDALSVKERDRLVRILTPILIGRGKTLFDEGDQATHLFIVTEGAIRLQRILADTRRQIIGFLYPGGFLGLTVQGHYAYSAEAVVASRLHRIPRHEFDKFMEGAPRFERQFFTMLMLELKIAQDQMLLLGRKNGTEKLASFFLMLSRHAARRGERSNPIHLPMNRRDVADYLGLTQEYVSRSLAKLKSSKLVRLLSAYDVQLLDTDKLTQVAAGDQCTIGSSSTEGRSRIWFDASEGGRPNGHGKVKLN